MTETQHQLLSNASIYAHANSFTDASMERFVAASVWTPDASAATAAQGAGIAQTGNGIPQRALPADFHRANTLDRGMDALTAQNLAVAPESQAGHAAREAAKRKRAKDDPEALPFVSEREKSQYDAYWNKFRRGNPLSSSSTTALSLIHI